jgi:hypothetical protein
MDAHRRGYRQVSGGCDNARASVRPIEQSLVEIAPLGRDELTEAICESGKLLRESLEVPVKCVGVMPGQCWVAEKRMIPPRGLEARLCLDDTLAMRERWRQRLRGCEEM